MVKQGDTIIMTVEELKIERESVIVTVIEKLKLDKQPEELELLDYEALMNFFKCGRTTIDGYRKRKKNPLPMVGKPPRITKQDAWEWYKKHSGEYQAE